MVIAFLWAVLVHGLVFGFIRLSGKSMDVPYCGEISTAHYEESEVWERKRVPL
jgi:hypothetical protein